MLFNQTLGFSLGGGGGGDVQPLLSLNLSTSIIPITGSASPAFQRLTGGTFLDFESTLKTVEIDEIACSGARRVRNLLVFPRDLRENIWAKTNGANAPAANILNMPVASAGTNQAYPVAQEGGEVYFFSATLLGVEATTMSLFITPAGTPSEISVLPVTLTPTPTRYSLDHTMLSVRTNNRVFITRGFSGTATQVTADFNQFELTTGQSNQNPSEFLAEIDYGAGIVGSKYFSYENGNTVDGNGVVTEAQGSAISEAILKGMLFEKGDVQLALKSTDFTDVAWSKSNITPTADTENAPTGLPAADTIAATAADGTILQTVVSAQADRTFTIWLKRKSGTGNVYLTLDGGAGWTIVTADISSMVRLALSQDGVTDPQFGVRIETSGDEVYAYNGMLSSSKFAMSDLESDAGTVSRDPHQLSYENSSNFLQSSFTITIEVTPLADGADYTDAEVRLFGGDDSRGVAYESRTVGDTDYGYTHLTGGGEFAIKKSDLVANTRMIYAMRAYQNGANIHASIWKSTTPGSPGTQVFETIVAGTLDHTTTTDCEIAAYAGEYFSGNAKIVKFLPGRITAAQLGRETTL